MVVGETPVASSPSTSAGIPNAVASSGAQSAPSSTPSLSSSVSAQSFRPSWSVSITLSSGVPSQSLSRPSHSSGPGPTPPAQPIEPFVHAVAPYWQVPTLEPQVRPPPGFPSSTCWLQLSSRLLHSSGLIGDWVAEASLQSRSDGEPSLSASTMPAPQTPEGRGASAAALPRVPRPQAL